VHDESAPPDSPQDVRPTEPAKRRSVVGLRQPRPPVSAEAVELLREALQQAESGQITDVVLIYARHDGVSASQRTELDYGPAILGEMWMAGDEICAAMNE